MPIPPRLVITASQVLWHHFQSDKSRLYNNAFPADASSPRDRLRVLTLPRSDIPLFPFMPSGASSKPASCSAACNGAGYFITSKSYSTPACVSLGDHSISTMQKFRPVHSEVRQWSFTPHTHHRHILDLRHIGRTAHLWAAFHSFICLGGSLPTSAGFRPQNRHKFCRLPQF